MHRTQVLLDDWQYEQLKSAAERDGRSISSLVRDAVTKFLRPPRSRTTATGLAEITGIGCDREISGRDHDRVLYGPRHKRR